MAKTNSGLVKYAKAMVGKPYWYGTYGQTATASLYESKKKQYPSYYKATDFSSQYGERVHDCVGLIKGYLWSDSTTSTPKYNSAQDKSAKGMYTASSLKGSISSFQKHPGHLVYKSSTSDTSGIHHVGVYDGNGYVYEAKGHNYGVVKTKYVATDWQYWSQCPYCTDDYTESTTTEVTASKKAQYYDSAVAGSYKVHDCSMLNVRDGAGTSNKALVQIPVDTVVKCYGYYSLSGSTKWLYIQFTYKDVIYTGFASINYLKKTA